MSTNSSYLRSLNQFYAIAVGDPSEAKNVLGRIHSPGELLQDPTIICVRADLILKFIRSNCALSSVVEILGEIVHIPLSVGEVLGFVC